jgi:lipid-binding SYLF domain-containing protein
MKTLPYLALATLLAFTAPQVRASSEQDQVNKAATTMQQFKEIPEKSIPPHVLRDAKGLAIITVAKGGFIFSGKIGQGVVVARTKNGWSGPSFVKTGGAGFGAQIGGQVTDFVIVLNTRAAVEAFARGGNVQLGGALSVAAGPVGRTASGDVTAKAAVYSYSRSKGLFAGASLEGAVIGTDKIANENYYGKDVSALTILNGKVAAPAGTARLERALGK